MAPRQHSSSTAPPGGVIPSSAVVRQIESLGKGVVPEGDTRDLRLFLEGKLLELEASGDRREVNKAVRNALETLSKAGK